MPPVTPQTTPALLHVRELPAGDKVTGFYLLTRLETRQKKDGVPYLVLHLQDATGAIEAIFWENFVELQQQCEAGDALKVEGQVDRYREIPRLTILRARKATIEEVPDRRQFLPHSALAAAEASKTLDGFIASLSNSHLRSLLEAVFNDDDFRAKFLEAPGGKLWHHATLGGLAEHTLSLTGAADKLAAHYPALDRDLLMTGALLHDIGKVFELSTDIAIDYNIEGRLLGHIVQGTLFLDRKIAAIPDFPEETRRQVLHLILSHQGDGTMGSPVKPMTLEALTLHYLDELDSKHDAFLRIKSQTPAGQELSEYVRLMERFFYFKPIEGRSEEQNER